MWTARIELEVAHWARQGRASSFVTMTYAPEHVPPGGSLSAEHWRAFSKGLGFRYFGVGEYGSTTGRPHYHAIIAGCPAGMATALLGERWRLGFSQVSEYTTERAAYVAGYVVKKWTRPREELGDRLPEFSRMSRRPGIGIPGLKWLADWLTTEQGCSYLVKFKDVPHQVKVNGSMYPLGETCVAYLRSEVGMPAQDPNRLRNHELRQEIMASEFPDLAARRAARALRGYDQARQRERRSSQGVL